jgi:hypothetical protein
MKMKFTAQTLFHILETLGKVIQSFFGHAEVVTSVTGYMHSLV